MFCHITFGAVNRNRCYDREIQQFIYNGKIGNHHLERVDLNTDDGI